MRKITVKNISEFRKNSEPVELVDVRTPAEFEEVHAEASINIPLDELTADAISRRNGKEVLVICQSGNRAKLACEKLIKAGREDVAVVEGGMQAWLDAGLPVVRGRKTMSLERQVRIAAGAIVLTGVVLAQFVHPALMWVSGFVGAGLMFAGITDTCGMGMLIAKMPWNRRPKSGCRENAE